MLAVAKHVAGTRILFVTTWALSSDPLEFRRSGGGLYQAQATFEPIKKEFSQFTLHASAHMAYGQCKNAIWT
jgi:hypothetical protein